MGFSICMPRTMSCAFLVVGRLGHYFDPYRDQVTGDTYRVLFLPERQTRFVNESGLLAWRVYCAEAGDLSLQVSSLQYFPQHMHSALLCYTLLWAYDSCNLFTHFRQGSMGHCYGDNRDKILSSNIWYKAHQIPKLICFSSRLAVVFTQSIEARC